MSEQRRVVALDYRPASPAPDRTRNVCALLWVASACWLLPLLGGLVYLFGYLLTEHDDFASAGFMLLPVGAVVALVGIAAAIIARAFAPSDPPVGRRLRRRAMLLFAAILLNFPAAWACASLGVSHMDAVQKRNGTWIDPSW